ncbi:MAG: GNAT family N-acetyltransferase [Candidatus Paceibacterota bacterium]
MEYKIRSAIVSDVEDVQRLRKEGWQDNYVNEETGVTKELLVNKLAKLPASQEDKNYFINTLSKPENKDKNLVAASDGGVIGVALYETLENGDGYIGVFIDRGYRGQGIGTDLLKELIKRTTNNLMVEIFSKNPSRKLYKNLGFVEDGPIGKCYFDKNIYLPTQKLILHRK